MKTTLLAVSLLLAIASTDALAQQKKYTVPSSGSATSSSGSSYAPHSSDSSSRSSSYTPRSSDSSSRSSNYTPRSTDSSTSSGSGSTTRSSGSSGHSQSTYTPRSSDSTGASSRQTTSSSSNSSDDRKHASQPTGHVDRTQRESNGAQAQSRTTSGPGNASIRRNGGPTGTGNGGSNGKQSDASNSNLGTRGKTSNSTDVSRNQGNRVTVTKPEQPSLRTRTSSGGVTEKVTSSGQVREKTLKKEDGVHTQQLSATGRVQKEEVKDQNGNRQVTQYAANGKVQRLEVAKRDGTRETTRVQYGRNGERATETVKVDARGRETSKTVVVKQTTVIARNTTIVNNRTIVKSYDHCRYGFAYHPVYAITAPVFVSWYDPYWYSPVGVLIPHPFHYAWGWDHAPWYELHHAYWSVYEVYPAPSYWVTDWLIAGYVADRYADSISAAEAREEARLAREDAGKAQAAAERAQDEAEIAEAHAAEQEAEARAAKAEARAAEAEARESRGEHRQQNMNAAPIDPATKEALRAQIEEAVLEKKQFAEAASKGGNPVAPDLSKSLADPKHIYPVSRPISVISATDQKPAGDLSEGDLVRLEPGQEEVLKDAHENTLVTVRVITAKGEEGETKAGMLVSLSLKDLQDFDSEFRAKLDLGLAEADANKDLFKSGAL